MIGHVAYALYKREKLAYCEAILSAQGRVATDQEIEAFLQASRLDLRIEAYRTDAEVLLQKFAEAMLAEAVQTIHEESNRELVRQMKEARPFWRSVGENYLASFFVAASIALVAVILYGSRVGFATVLGDILGYEVRERTPAVSAPSGN